MVDRVHAGLDDVLAADLSALDDGALCEATVELHRAEARLTAARSRFVAEVDRREAYASVGAQTAAAYLAKESRLPSGVARHQVATARALRHLPAAYARLADGEINAWHASRLAGHFANPRVREQLERDEDMLSNEASHLPFGLFEKVLAYWAQLADPDGTDADAEARKAKRRLHVSRTLDGCFKLDGLFDPVDGAVIDTALRRIETELFEADQHEARDRLGREPICGDLRRSPQQRRADALVELAKRAMASPPGARRPRPLVSVLCSYETFAGRVCELADGTVIAPSDVAALLDEAVIERAVFDGPSRVMDIGHQRLFTGAVRRAIELRDRMCTHPYCDRRADESDIDHIKPAGDGGITVQQNGRVYCPFHNHLRQKRPDLDDP